MIGTCIGVLAFFILLWFALSAWDENQKMKARMELERQRRRADDA